MDILQNTMLENVSLRPCGMHSDSGILSVNSKPNIEEKFNNPKAETMVIHCIHRIGMRLMSGIEMGVRTAADKYRIWLFLVLT